MNVREAKHRLNIFDVWKLLDLPGDPHRNPCASPWRDGKFCLSITKDGKGFHCFASDDSGDVVTFIEHALGLSNKDACTRLISLAGAVPFVAPDVCRVTLLKPDEPRPRPTFPKFEEGTYAEACEVATIRNLDSTLGGILGVDLARQQGLLKFATLRGHRCWIITDSEGVNAQARRMDGKLWPHIGNTKAWTLPGSWASWPIGIREAVNADSIALLEGGPDLLAAFSIIFSKLVSDLPLIKCAPVAMLGASNKIHTDALELFRGKRVRIFPHADDAGYRAKDRWMQQLTEVGATADCFELKGLLLRDGSQAKDLNDLVSNASHEVRAKLIHGIPPR